MTRHMHCFLLSAVVVLASCGQKPPSAPAADRPQPDTARPVVPTTPAAGDNAPVTAPTRRAHHTVPLDTAETPGPVVPTIPGAVDSATVTPPLRDAYHTAPLDTVDGRTYQGWKYFNLNCSRCHGEDVTGTLLAPHLLLSLKPDGAIPNQAIFLETVCGGRPAKGMPAWCALGLSPAQIDTIYAYVKGRSDAALHPGRPARKVE